MNDDQFEILDEPEEAPRKGKHKPKSRPLGIPWRWVFAAFAAGAGLALLFLIPTSIMRTPKDALVVEAATFLPSPPARFNISGEIVEDVAWHGDTMAAATTSRMGLYENLTYLKNVDAYKFANKAQDNFLDLAFSLDGTQLAAIRSEYWFQDGRLMPAAYVSIWNANGEFTNEFMAHSGSDGGFTRYLGVATAYSPNGRLLATGAGKGEITLWDTNDYQPIGHIFTGATGTVDLAFSDDGQRLTALLRGDDGTDNTNWADSGSIQLWNVGEPQNPVKEPFAKYLQRDVGLKAAISPDGQFAAFVELIEENQCCYANSLQIWDVHAGSLILEIPLDEQGSTIENLTFSEDSDSLTFVEQHIIEQEDGYGILQNDLRVFGWTKVEDGSYQLQDMGSKFNIGSMPYNLHVNDDGTWVQYITTPYNIVERWTIATGEVQNMSL